jgi:2-methylaconitate cis-trans-isomerase PrpF
VIGSPAPYGKQIDGMGGATSSTSKVVLVSKSKRADCDVDYLFGAVAIEAPIIDWSGNYGNQERRMDYHQSGDEPEQQTANGRMGAGSRLN